LFYKWPVIILKKGYVMKKLFFVFYSMLLVFIFSCSNPDTSDSESKNYQPQINTTTTNSTTDASDDEEIYDDKITPVKKKWTILVYMAADNNLSDYSALDINEMKTVGSNDSLNVVVLWDDQSTHHGYYYIDKNKTKLLKKTGEVNTGDISTATDFINYSVNKFPSEKYMWIYWNHGGAVDRNIQKGVAWDETHNNDHLSEVEQKKIFSYFYDKINKKIDIVGFDACLMATAELMYQYKDFANYLIASEQTIAGEGWDYKFLNSIVNNPDITPVNLSKSVLEYYKAFYLKETDVTLSIANLESINILGKLLDTFSNDVIKSGITGSSFYKLAQKEDFSGYTKDLYVYLKNISKSKTMTNVIKTDAENIMKNINDNLIIGEWHGSTWKSKAYGVSITLKSDTSIYSELDICKDTKWDEFLTFADF
jgi:hypothetical protein